MSTKLSSKEIFFFLMKDSCVPGARRAELILCLYHQRHEELQARWKGDSRELVMCTVGCFSLSLFCQEISYVIAVSNKTYDTSRRFNPKKIYFSPMLCAQLWSAGWAPLLRVTQGLRPMEAASWPLLLRSQWGHVRPLKLSPESDMWLFCTVQGCSKSQDHCWRFAFYFINLVFLETGSCSAPQTRVQ